MKQRFFAFMLSICLAMSMLSVPSLAGTDVQENGFPTGGEGLCEHHPSHDESCGYREEKVGNPCSHEHTEDCYMIVTDCVHRHTESCYPVEREADSITSPSEMEKIDPIACTHVCTEESGCIREKLDCRHEHINGDENCGYDPAATGMFCTFVCEICYSRERKAVWCMVR